MDESLDPEGPDQLYDLVAALDLPPAPRVLDLGCGRGTHSVELARRFLAAVVGVDPDRAVLTEARDQLEMAARDEPALVERVRFTRGSAEVVPIEDGVVDLVWCRDVLCLVADLERAYGECARVLRPGGSAIVYQMFATERLERAEATELYRATDCIAASMDPLRTEQAIDGAGLRVERRIVLGSEWGEHIEERSHKAGRLLLHASRLLRAPDRYVGRFGRRNVEIKLGDCLWHVYRLLGKLSGRVYVLSKPD